MNRISIFVLALALVIPGLVSAQFTGPQGGTGVKGIYAGSIPFGGTSLVRVATSSAFSYNNSLALLTVTNASTTNISFSGYATGTNLYGFGLSTCNGASQALTYSAGLFGCQTITVSGDGVSNWLYNGTRLTPSTTVGVGIFASSTITHLSMIYGTTTNAYISNLNLVSAIDATTETTIENAIDTLGTITLSYASTTGISGTNLNFTNATSSSSFFSALGTFTNSVINTLLTAVSGIFTTSLQIPNGTAPTVDATGEIALDTTDNQLLVGTSTTGLNVVRTKEEIYKFSIPSTSPAFAAGTTKYVPALLDGYVADTVWCGVEGGTSKIITVLGSTLTCTTGAGVSTTPSVTIVGAGSTTVGTTASTTSGVVNWLNVTITGRYTRE